MERIALFPGSFDPFTVGHKAVVDQGLKIFDKVVIGVGISSSKRSLLTSEARVRLIEDLYKDEPRIAVKEYSNLTGEFCYEVGAKFILRGMRNTVDFEYERSLMLINQSIAPDITTILLFTPPEFLAISSSFIREIHNMGKDVSHLMPEGIDIKKYL